MTQDIISAEVLHARLASCTIGGKIIFKSVMPSTMYVALEELEKDTPQGTVVICEKQTRGKGRLGREWISPVGGLYLSIILFPKPEMVSYLTLISSLAVLDSVKEMCGIKASIKWPNDILIKGKKVAGILAQSGNIQGCLYAIVGIGINANLEVSSLSEISETAISLSEVIGEQVSRLELITSLLQRFEKRYEQLEAADPFLQEFQGNLDTLGKPIRVKCGSEVFAGIAESINSSGNLIIRLTDGTLKEIPAGDVTLRI